MVTSGPKWPMVASVQRFDVRLQQLLDAMLSIASDLSLPTVLQRIIESACKLVDARYGALGVVDEHGQLTDLVTSGVDDQTHQAVGRLPEFKGILGVLLGDPKPVRLRDLSEHPLAQGFPAGHPQMTSFLGVPIRGREAVGSLYLADKQSADEFSVEDERLAVTLAAASGVAIENARLQSSLEHLAVLEDRERIARELHDKVIQRLFAAGMTLQTTLPIARSEVASHITQAVEEIDETIRDIRRTISRLDRDAAYASTSSPTSMRRARCSGSRPNFGSKARSTRPSPRRLPIISWRRCTRRCRMSPSTQARQRWTWWSRRGTSSCSWSPTTAPGCRSGSSPVKECETWNDVRWSSAGGPRSGRVKATAPSSNGECRSADLAPARPPGR